MRTFMMFMFFLSHPNFLGGADMEASILSSNYRESRKTHVTVLMCGHVYTMLNALGQQIHSLGYFIDIHLPIFTPGGGTKVIRFFTVNCFRYAENNESVTQLRY